LSRYARKVDGNQSEIVRVLTVSGAMVQSMASIGRGCPDLLVGFRGKWVVMEVKDGSKSPSSQKLREAQVTWMLAAQHHDLPAVVVTDVDGALRAIGL